MTATQIIREALEIYARSTLGADRYLAERLAAVAEEMAEASGYGEEPETLGEYSNGEPCC